MHQMRAEASSVNISAAASTGGVVADAARDDHVWMLCQGDGGQNSEPVLDNDIKVRELAAAATAPAFEDARVLMLCATCHFCAVFLLDNRDRL